ncbi:hypothetical protein OM076_12520 [Solirubrobacter ginsenosidimutans]|uniref:Uncharacterized protein n=1 Tax=Solirubrobacter ginsenosidimutans TaxID=490573 RepID=A0A9X3MRH1_9ACTN|nr:hypothetical protein [Solirubrobacter ginsenosidimutans]MDA0161095.1 hypothetical protein [Solirubrobacter ginsenosidimutans]
MSDEDNPKSFEETLRAIADEVTRGLERVQRGEGEDLAREYGIDADRAKRFMDTAGDWLRSQADAFNVGQSESAPAPGQGRSDSRPADTPWTTFPSGAGPDPLDVPSDDQGRALAALDSGRWEVEPGTSALSSRGDGPGPSDALGLVRELRVRDWIDADGEVTQTGHAALQRWLDAAVRD